MINLSKNWNLTRSRVLIWDTITTTGWSSLGKAVGFLIPFFIAAWFGITSETDAFFFAYGLILFLSGVFAPVVETVIVPYIAEARANSEDVGRFVGRVLGISGVSLLVLIGITLLVIKPILSIITLFDLKNLNLVYHLLIETAPLIIFLVWTSVLAGALNAYKRFAIPAISPAFRAIVNLSIIFIFKGIFGIHAIALGYVVGEVVRLIILLTAIKQLNLFKLYLSFDLRPELREFLKDTSYQTIGMVAIGLNPIVDKTMASWLGGGSVSVLHYADRLYMIPIAFMTSGLMVTLLSHWSSRYYGSGQHRLKEDVKKAIKVVGFITLPIMLFLLLFHRPIVRLAFGRGAFDQTKLLEVGWVWVFYLLGLVPTIIGLIFVRAHLVLKNTRILMKIAFFTVVMNALWNYVFMHYLGIKGIALSTSIIMFLTSILQGVLLYRKMK